MYLEEMKKRESHSQDMEVFLHTAFPPELGARPGIFSGLQGDQDGVVLADRLRLEPLTVGGRVLEPVRDVSPARELHLDCSDDASRPLLAYSEWGNPQNTG